MEHQFELHRIGYNFVHENGVNIDRKNGTDDYLLLYLKSNVTILTEEGEITTAVSGSIAPKIEVSVGPAYLIARTKVILEIAVAGNASPKIISHI